MREFIEKMTIDDLPGGDIRIVAERCGLDVALKLLWECDGMQLYISKTAKSQIVRKYICDNYDGKNSKQLAVETGYSEPHIYNILKNNPKNKKKAKEEPFEQMDLFERGGLR